MALSIILELLCAEQNIVFFNARSITMGLQCAEHNVGNLNKCTFRNYGTPVHRTRRRKTKQRHFQEFWDSCAQNKTSEISKNALSRIMGLLCAEQNVGTLKTWTFRNSGTPVRRTTRRKYQKNDFQEFGDSCAQNETSEIPKKWTFRNWYSCAQNETSEI